MLRSALAHAREQTVILNSGVRAVRAARAVSVWAALDVLTDYQERAAVEGVQSVDRMLAEQGISIVGTAIALPDSLVGVASDGRGLDTLLNRELTRLEFDRIVKTQLADVARNGEVIAQATRPAATHYVRVLSGTSCSRCAVLAGAVYGSEVAFLRHPQCDCRHVPTNAEGGRRLAGSARSYFDSLPRAGQDRTFTKAGAEAIRLGADPAAVVNARSGMSTAQVRTRGPGDRWTASGRLTTRRVYGRDVYTTTEGTTKRGVANRAMRAAGKNPNRTPRLMPESILQLATDKADAIRMLRLHGYVI